MFRRLQSVFLLTALVLITLLFTFPVISYITEQGEIYQFGMTGLSHPSMLPAEIHRNLWPLPFLGVSVVLTLLASIILYKNRMIQMRLAVFTAVLLLGLQGMFVFFIFQIRYAFPYTGSTFHVGIIFPLVAFLLVVISIRAIRKDEILELARKRFG